MKAKLLLLAVLVTLCNIVSAGIPSITFTIVNTGVAAYPGGSALVTISAHTSWQGAVQYIGVNPYIPPLNPGDSSTVTCQTGDAGMGYPICDWVDFSLGCGYTTITHMGVSQGNPNEAVYVNSVVGMNYGFCYIGAYVPPAPTTTNVTQCIQNTSGHGVTADASLGGNSLGSKWLNPGETWCLTADVNLDGSSGDFKMGYTVNSPDSNGANSDNPFGTNAFGSAFNSTNGFSSLTNSDNPFGGVFTNVIQGGGGGYTNTISVNSSNFSSVLWTNNINYPNSGTAGDARDSTLKAGFGQLHNDNATTLAALKLIWTDSQGIKVLASMMTNELGQVIAAIYHLTNSDQLWPNYVNSVTNNANANQIASTAAITNAIGREQAAITNAVAQGGNSSQLTNLNNTMGGISNLFSQISNGTNGDIATETTQAGISNLLSSIGRSLTNGSQIVSNVGYQASTNRATESTLAKIWDWLYQGWTNRLVAATNWPSPPNGSSDAGANEIGYMQAVIDSLSTAPDLGGDPGHTGIWEMDFCGRRLNFDPVFLFPGVCAFSVGLWDFVLVAMYLLALGKVDYEIAKTLTSVQTGSVPDVSVIAAGTGGNAVPGVIAGGLVTVALMLLFQILVTAIIVPLGEFLGLYQAIATVFSAAKSTPQGAAGVHVLFALFPVQLAIRLFTSYLSLYFSLAIQVTIFSRAARFLLVK